MNDFIWTDLSTYYPKEVIPFYENVFGWNFHDAGGYHVAFTEHGEEVCGVYETPSFFQKIKMPHFWMNYIQVEDLKATAKLAEQLGGKIEVNDEVFYGGRIALIRDTLGAGFTVYEGKKLKQSVIPASIQRELHVSNVSKAIDFYGNLFDWELRPSTKDHIEIFNAAGSRLGAILELPNSTKGTYEYWVTVFKVNDLASTRQRIAASGGTVISDEGYRMLFADPLGEAFFYIQALD